MCGTLKKKNTHKRGGESGCLRGVKLWGPFPYQQTDLHAIVYYFSFCSGKCNAQTSEGALQHAKWCCWRSGSPWTIFPVSLLPWDATALLLNSSKLCLLARRKENASFLGVISFVVRQKVIKSSWFWSLLGRHDFKMHSPSSEQGEQVLAPPHQPSSMRILALVLCECCWLTSGGALPC